MRKSYFTWQSGIKIDCYVPVECQSCGYVHINGEEVEESKFDIIMQMYAKKLDKKDFFGKV